MNDDDFTVINTYGAEYRGLIQYYLLAKDVYRLSKVNWVMLTSLLKTLACKHDSSVSKMAAKYMATIDTPHGPRRCFQISVERGGGRKPLVARFGGIPLKRQTNAVLTDRQPVPATIRRKELISRLLQGRCEICEHAGEMQVHHVRKLANLHRPGQPQPAVGAAHDQTSTQIPRGLQRLSRPHPRATRHTDHAVVTGEPVTGKPVRRVREGTHGKRTDITCRHRARGSTSPCWPAMSGD